MNICPLCQRPMPEGSYNSHHLIPKTYKGTETVDLHRICHDKIHHTFTESELKRHYHTIERLLENDVIRSYVKWVKKQPPNYYDHHKDTKDRKRKR